MTDNGPRGHKSDPIDGIDREQLYTDAAALRWHDAAPKDDNGDPVLEVAG